jgi:N4-(beta-N-acetylglucosaminyl)-L-asparaginase
MELIRGGADTLDAAIAGVNIVEEDPEDTSVGYGGLPNEEGVVELDACVMHGPTWGAGAVAALQKIKTPSSVAKLVMTRTDHVLLVGEGALRFALAHGFEPVNLLTDRARKEWLEWKESHSDKDDWLTPAEAEARRKKRPTGTINCLALDAKGDVSGVTSTSGLAFKLPGRVGDSPIIGAGLYVDNDAGAAGATGRGEAVITAGGSRIVVENMRRGMAPAEAVRDVLERIARQTVDPRLRDAQGRPAFDVTLYALDKSGRHASGSLWSGKKYAVHDGKENAARDCFHLFERA